MKFPDLTTSVWNLRAITLFRQAIAIMSVVNLLILLPLWTQDVPVYELIHPIPGSGLLYNMTHLLTEANSGIHKVFILANFIASILLFYVRWRIPACLVLLFTGHSIVNLCYPYLNMSQYLLLALTMYLLFMDERADARKGVRGVISRGLTNAFYIICWAQVLAAYIFPFIYKVQGEMWLNGIALGTILSIPEFSRGFILEYARPDHWLMMLLTWTTLLYQAVFPILIWWKKAKPYLLIAGVMFNLGIAVAMGLVDIAVVMIAAYAILLDRATIHKLRSWVPVLSRRKEADLSSSV